MALEHDSGHADETALEPRTRRTRLEVPAAERGRVSVSLLARDLGTTVAAVVRAVEHLVPTHRGLEKLNPGSNLGPALEAAVRARLAGPSRTPREPGNVVWLG